MTTHGPKMNLYVLAILIEGDGRVLELFYDSAVTLRASHGQAHAAMSKPTEHPFITLSDDYGREISVRSRKVVSAVATDMRESFKSGELLTLLKTRADVSLRNKLSSDPIINMQTQQGPGLIEGGNA